MENQLQIFENEEFGKIRTLFIDGEIYFVATDVCRALDLGNTTMALLRLNDDEKKIIDLNGVTNTLNNIEGIADAVSGGWIKNEVNIVNEPGLYRLIFQSNKPNAVKFQRWVYHEVLPSIRKYGYYAVPSIENVLNNMAQELTSDSAELACLTAQTPAITLQIKAMMEKFLADYNKNPHKIVPVIEDLPGEIWKWIKEYEGVYQASNQGRARSFFRGKCRLLKPTVTHRGYLGICLYRYDEKTKKQRKKTFRLNRIIAETFIPNPENKPEVHHKNNDKTDNRAENLEWVTGEENREYAHEDGCYLKGEKNPTAKLTEEDVRFIRQNYKAGDLEFGQGVLAKKYGVSTTTIRNIVTFKSWEHVQ